MQRKYDHHRYKIEWDGNTELGTKMLGSISEPAVAHAAATASGALAHSVRDAERIIVMGSGVAGKYATIRAAEAGFNVTVIEKFPEVATRKTLFNLAPSVIDELARVDGGGDGLTKALSPIVSRFKLSSPTAEQEANAARNGLPGLLHREPQSVRATHLEPDPTRPVNAQSLVDGFHAVDRRPWGRVSIEGIENHMREYINSRFGEQVTWKFETTVESVEQAANAVTAHTVNAQGLHDTVDGAWLISTTGGRNPMGIKRDMFPDKAHYVGGLLTPVKAEDVILPRAFIDGARFDAATHSLNPPGKTWASVGLPWDKTHGLVWAQVAADAKGMDEQLLRKVLNERIRVSRIEGEVMDGSNAILPVSVQLGMLHTSPAVQGRVILAGDELLAPYFPTSTGAGHAFSANGPLLGDLIESLAKGGDQTVALATYNTKAHDAAELVLKSSRAQMLSDLNLPVPEWKLDMAENLGRLETTAQVAP